MELKICRFRRWKRGIVKQRERQKKKKRIIGHKQDYIYFKFSASGTVSHFQLCSHLAGVQQTQHFSIQLRKTSLNNSALSEKHHVSVCSPGGNFVADLLMHICTPNTHTSDSSSSWSAGLLSTSCLIFF